MPTHPADGLFYLSSARLYAQDACRGHMDIWLDKHGDKQVPVTQDILWSHISQACRYGVASSAAWWLIYTLRLAHNLPYSDYLRLTDGIHVLAPQDQAGRVMDALEIIARRKGLLP